MHFGDGSKISQRGAPTRGRGVISLLFGDVLAKNCMKMKEIGNWNGASLVPIFRQYIYFQISKIMASLLSVVVTTD